MYRTRFIIFTSCLLLAFGTAACRSAPASPASTIPFVPSLVIPTPPACTTIITEPTPGADTPSLFPPESEADHVRGAVNPSVTITEYSDYQDLRSGLLQRWWIVC